MPIFRKKPIEIEAFQIPANGEVCSVEMQEFLNRACTEIDVRSNGSIIIHTLEGKMKAVPGDWIIRGTAGEYYPCKPGVFSDIYEQVT